MEYPRKEVLSKVLISLRQQGKQSIAELVLSTRLPYGVIQKAVKTLEEKGLIRIEKVRANPVSDEETEPVDTLDIIDLNE